MKDKKSVYYLIWDSFLVKREKNDNNCKDYLFKDGKWVEDSEHIVIDHLFLSHDPSKPEGSTHRFSDTSIITKIDEIPEKQAVEIMNRQILEILKKKWSSEFAEQKKEWDKKPGWPAKLVEIKYVLNGLKYSLLPADIGLSNDCWNQGFMETIQSDMSKDLKEYDATDIFCNGFLD